MTSPRPTISCPHCKARIVAAPSRAGKKVACPRCSERFQMPDRPAAPASGAAPPSEAPPVPASSPAPPREAGQTQVPQWMWFSVAGSAGLCVFLAVLLIMVNSSRSSANKENVRLTAEVGKLTTDNTQLQNNLKKALDDINGKTDVIDSLKRLETENGKLLQNNTDLQSEISKLKLEVSKDNRGEQSNGEGRISLESMKLEGDYAVLKLKEPLPSGKEGDDLEMRVLFLRDPHGVSIRQIDEVNVSGSATFFAGNGLAGATATLFKNGVTAGFHISYLSVPVVKGTPETIRVPVNPAAIRIPDAPLLAGTGRVFAAIMKRNAEKRYEVVSNTMSVKYPGE